MIKILLSFFSGFKILYPIVLFFFLAALGGTWLAGRAHGIKSCEYGALRKEKAAAAVMQKKEKNFEEKERKLSYDFQKKARKYENEVRILDEKFFAYIQKNNGTRCALDDGGVRIINSYISGEKKATSP